MLCCSLVPNLSTMSNFCYGKSWGLGVRGELTSYTNFSNNDAKITNHFFDQEIIRNFVLEIPRGLGGGHPHFL